MQYNQNIIHNPHVFKCMKDLLKYYDNWNTVSVSAELNVCISVSEWFETEAPSQNYLLTTIISNNKKYI